MVLMGFLTTTDKAQAIVIYRWLWSIALYIVFFIIGLISIQTGILKLSTQLFLASYSLVFLVHGLFFYWLRFGFTENFNDELFVYCQVIFSFIVIFYFMLFMDFFERIALLNGAVTGLVFGIFSLNLRQLISLAIIPLLGYAVFIIRDYLDGQLVLSVQVSILHWVVTAIVFGFCAALGGYLSNLREKIQGNRNYLLRQKEELQVTYRELESVFRQMSEKAVRDELTGLYNRHQFSETLHALISVAQASASPLGLILIDIDHFKPLNDTHGHLVGDEVLKYFSSIPENCLRDSDFMARFGGEEFVILLPDTDADKVIQMAEKIRVFIEKKDFAFIKQGLKITISLGATLYHLRETPEQLMMRADQTLYAAKDAGRNKLIFKV